MRRLLVVAAAASLPLAGSAQTPAAAPAPAAAPIVQVYGTLNVNLQYTEAKSATTSAQNVAPRFAISIDSSNIGVRGTADLGGGLKAVYQCETQASIDGEDTRAICNRNSRIGLSNDFGTLFYGNWDTPYKAAAYGTKADDPFGNTDVFGYQGIMGSPGYGTRSTAMGASAPAPTAAGSNAGFDVRAANSVAYWSPKFSGVSAKLQVGLDDFRSADGRTDPVLVSGAVNFDMGGLSVVGQVEYHEDYYGIVKMNALNTATVNAKDLAWRLSAGYEIPLGDSALTVSAMYEQLSYKQESAKFGFKEYSRPAWQVGAKYRMGDHELRARYSQALKPSITAAPGTPLPAGAEDDLGAQQLALGYAYSFAKNTQAFLFYTQITNEDRAKYTFGVSGATNVVGANTPAGSNPSAIGLGLRQAF